MRIGDVVTCSEVPGRRFEVVDVLGVGDMAQYRLKDGNGNWYGYVGIETLSRLKTDL